MDSIKHYLSSHEASDIHPSELAKILKELTDEEFANEICLVPKELLGDVALELPDRYFDQIASILSVEELSIAVTELESDDQVDFMDELKEVDAELASKVFDLLGKEDQEEIEKLSKYDENEAGAYMQLELFTAYKEEIVEDVIQRFAKLRNANELENVQSLFIVGKEKKLRYTVALDQLLVFDFKRSLLENIEASKHSFEPKSAKDREDIKEVVHYFEEYNLATMPVVNTQGILLGRITSDDVYDLINEHATEQMYHLAGLDDDVEDDEAVIKAAKKRASWLIVNLFTAIAASLVIGVFSETIDSMVALAILMPIVASMGGNAGTQSLTVVVRQLALGELSKYAAVRIVKKELFIALGNGFFFALLMGIIAYLWFGIEMLGVVIALSMIINLLMAGFFGATVPLLLKRLHIDPAIGSTVILTTVTDVIGFFSFLGLATLILL